MTRGKIKSVTIASVTPAFTSGSIAGYSTSFSGPSKTRPSAATFGALPPTTSLRGVAVTVAVIETPCSLKPCSEKIPSFESLESSATTVYLYSCFK